jgi:hypothetical protein
VTTKRLPVIGQHGDEVVAFVAHGPDSIGAGVVKVQIGGEFGFECVFSAADFSEFARQALNASAIASGLKVAA